MCIVCLPLPAANLLLQHTVERIHVGKQFGDIPRGIYLVRGENVALCGEIVSSTQSVCDLLTWRLSFPLPTSHSPPLPPPPPPPTPPPLPSPPPGSGRTQSWREVSRWRRCRLTRFLRLREWRRRRSRRRGRRESSCFEPGACGLSTTPSMTPSNRLHQLARHSTMLSSVYVHLGHVCIATHS